VSTCVYIIGIDLGTTNSIVAYTKACTKNGEKPDIQVFKTPQLTDASTLEQRDILPSFVFIPEKHDVSQNALALPWDSDAKLAVGEFARDRGSEIPSRLISSAKSWLCHTLVDRNKPILPWQGPDEVSKLSPVEASSVILQHIRDAWNHEMATQDENLKMENQDIFLTVPASFDAVARELTVKAAKMAGLENITLLEEPQAAFYSWIEAAGDRWRDIVKEGDLVLICDVGGGTSDFSLIRVLADNGDLALERIAVGDHLLVGGDNMDLALAFYVSNSMAKKGVKLDSWQIRGLIHSCRKAKEKIFINSENKEFPLTILGRGSSLIGGTIKTKISAKEVENLILDGFFPECSITDRPIVQQKTGIKELGLSYESDPSVTRNLAKFIGQRAEDKPEIPTAIFFNGGVMKAPQVRKRIKDLLLSWGRSDETPGNSFHEAGQISVREIETTDFDLSVARGAAYYGITRQEGGVRIRGGLGRSYYIGVAASMPAVPGMPAPVKALCVAPFGMEEGTDAMLSEKEFVLVVGEPVKFDLMESSIRHDDEIGTMVEQWEEEIEEITSIETILDGEKGSVVPVTIEIKVTEVGTLEFWCVSKDSGQRWKLEFNVRERNDFGA
jgi:molecular chaperone DnaK (HSP70)